MPYVDTLRYPLAERLRSGEPLAERSISGRIWQEPTNRATREAPVSNV